jgi:integrase
MGILAECSDCRRKQSVKNKKCKCGENLVKLKKAKKVRYWIDYPLPNGKVRRESVGSFEDLNPYSITDARTALAKRTVQKREKRILEMLPGTDLIFDELTEWYLDLPDVKKLRSYDNIVSVLKAFNGEFGNYIVNAVLPEDLKRYQQKRLSKGLKPRSIDKEIGQAQTVVEQGFLNRKIDGEALRAFKSVKKLLIKGTNARKRTISIEEYFKLTAVAAPHARDMMIVAYNTGMRPGEVRALRWSYIDWQNGFIELPPEATKEGAKSGETKCIPMNHNVKAVLDKRRPSPGVVSEEHHDYVFTYQGKPIKGKQGSRKSFKTACKNAGLVYGEDTQDGVIFHDFRRSVKTNMLTAGIQKEYRDKLLGHSLKGMDRHYIVPGEDDLKNAMDQYTDWLDSQVEAIWKNLDHSLDHATKKGLTVLVKSLKTLVPPARIELAAHGLGIHCSIH